MRKEQRVLARFRRVVVASVGVLILCFLIYLSVSAPEHLSEGLGPGNWTLPADAPPFGTDERGRPLLEYAQQGARVVLGPAICAAFIVAFFAIVGGVLRAIGWTMLDTCVQVFAEIVNALPRLVPVLIVALGSMTGTGQASLMPIAIVWAILAAPGAMDEAAAVAERLGGARFVEALRAHGFSASRIYVHHIVFMNLRPVILRQAGEVLMQVIFLEIALSYLAKQGRDPSFTHPDSTHSWAELFSIGYPSIAFADPTIGGRHAFDLGLLLVGLVAVMSLCIRHLGRAR